MAGHPAAWERWERSSMGVQAFQNFRLRQDAVVLNSSGQPEWQAHLSSENLSMFVSHKGWWELAWDSSRPAGGGRSCCQW